jgi:hypothetical protein
MIHDTELARATESTMLGALESVVFSRRRGSWEDARVVERGR